MEEDDGSASRMSYMCVGGSQYEWYRWCKQYDCISCVGAWRAPVVVYGGIVWYDEHDARCYVCIG